MFRNSEWSLTIESIYTNTSFTQYIKQIPHIIHKAQLFYEITKQHSLVYLDPTTIDLHQHQNSH